MNLLLGDAAVHSAPAATPAAATQTPAPVAPAAAASNDAATAVPPPIPPGSHPASVGPFSTAFALSSGSNLTSAAAGGSAGVSLAGEGANDTNGGSTTARDRSAAYLERLGHANDPSLCAWGLGLLVSGTATASSSSRRGGGTSVAGAGGGRSDGAHTSGGTAAGSSGNNPAAYPLLATLGSSSGGGGGGAGGGSGGGSGGGGGRATGGGGSGGGGGRATGGGGRPPLRPGQLSRAFLASAGSAVVGGGDVAACGWQAATSASGGGGGSGSRNDSAEHPAQAGAPDTNNTAVAVAAAAAGPAVVAGPVAAGPVAAGPVAAGPGAAGPAAAGPAAAGPPYHMVLPSEHQRPLLVSLQQGEARQQWLRPDVAPQQQQQQQLYHTYGECREGATRVLPDDSASGSAVEEAPPAGDPTGVPGEAAAAEPALAVRTAAAAATAAEAGAVGGGGQALGRVSATSAAALAPAADRACNRPMVVAPEVVAPAVVAAAVVAPATVVAAAVIAPTAVAVAAAAVPAVLQRASRSSRAFSSTRVERVAFSLSPTTVHTSEFGPSGDPPQANDPFDSSGDAFTATAGCNDNSSSSTMPPLGRRRRPPQRTDTSTRLQQLLNSFSETQHQQHQQQLHTLHELHVSPPAYATAAAAAAAASPRTPPHTPSYARRSFMHTLLADPAAVGPVGVLEAAEVAAAYSVASLYGSSPVGGGSSQRRRSILLSRPQSVITSRSLRLAIGTTSTNSESLHGVSACTSPQLQQLPQLPAGAWSPPPPPVVGSRASSAATAAGAAAMPPTTIFARASTGGLMVTDTATAYRHSTAATTALPLISTAVAGAKGNVHPTVAGTSALAGAGTAAGAAVSAEVASAAGLWNGTNPWRLNSQHPPPPQQSEVEEPQQYPATATPADAATPPPPPLLLPVWHKVHIRPVWLPSLPESDLDQEHLHPSTTKAGGDGVVQRVSSSGKVGGEAVAGSFAVAAATDGASSWHKGSKVEGTGSGGNGRPKLVLVVTQVDVTEQVEAHQPLVQLLQQEHKVGGCMAGHGSAGTL